jgi:catechol 2,3-dioxygenase-like lactoylglutathione lyase family enzyme
MTDRGLTHVALPVTDVDASVDFYGKYAEMRVVHERRDPDSGGRVVWISDGTRPFVVVLIELGPDGGSGPDRIGPDRLGGIAHLGVGLDSRAEVERRCAAAHGEGRDVLGPTDSGYPVGYWGLIVDPDGHNLELSYGQEVALAVERTGGPKT